MKLNDWIDKQDGVDDVLAKDINDIAHAIQENSKDIEGKADSLDIPTKVSELTNDSGYLVAADVENKADKPQRVMFSNGDTITLADNTTYYAENTINTLTVVYPETDFIASLDFTLADDGDITLTLPQSKYIGGVPTFANGETWELNIKNGVVVGGLIE